MKRRNGGWLTMKPQSEKDVMSHDGPLSAPKAHNRLLWKMTAAPSKQRPAPYRRGFSPLRGPANSCRRRPRPALLSRCLGPFPTQLLHTSTDCLKVISRTGSAPGAQFLHAGADRGKVVGGSRSRHGSSLCLPRLRRARDWEIMVNEASALTQGPRCALSLVPFAPDFCTP